MNAARPHFAYLERVTMLSMQDFIRQSLTVALLATSVLSIPGVCAAASPEPPEESLQIIQGREAELKSIVEKYDQKGIGRAIDADSARVDLLYLYTQTKNHPGVRDIVQQLISKETFRPARVEKILDEYLTANPAIDGAANLQKAKETFAARAKSESNAPPAQARESETKIDSPALQPGSYLYLGTKPGKQPLKAFSVNSLGELSWQSNARDLLISIKDQLPHEKMATPELNGPGSENIETYNYPMIKWQPKPVSTIPGAFIQLQTLYDGKLKCKTTLFKATALPRSLHITLLDQFGFKLADVRIDQNDWSPLPGSNLYEARNDGFCSELEYRKARDFSIR